MEQDRDILDQDCDGLPTKEQFDAWCAVRVPQLVVVLEAALLQRYAAAAIAGHHMPLWAKNALFGVYQGPPSPAAPDVQSKRVRPRRGLSRRGEQSPG